MSHATAALSPRSLAQSASFSHAASTSARARGRRSSVGVVPRASSADAVPSVDVDAAKLMLDRGEHMFIDARTWKEYDRSHITKPVQKTINVPFDVETRDCARWAADAAAKTRPAQRLLIADADGTDVLAMTAALIELGYSNACAVEGGYAAWIAKYTTSGRKQPPKGKWISTGKEALKSGLDLDPNVAAAYEENWGKAPPKYGDEAASRERGA
jgi:rhodanese-related sulfurtransferase